MTEVTLKQNKKPKSSLAKRSLQKFTSNKLAMFGLIIVLLMTLASIFAPLLASHDPNAIDMSKLNQAPGNGNIFGTDST